MERIYSYPSSGKRPSLYNYDRFGGMVLEAERKSLIFSKIVLTLSARTQFK